MLIPLSWPVKDRSQWMPWFAWRPVLTDRRNGHLRRYCNVAWFRPVNRIWRGGNWWYSTRDLAWLREKDTWS